MVVKVKGHKRSGGKVKVKAHKRSSPHVDDLPFKAGDDVKKKSGSKKYSAGLKSMAKREPKPKYKVGDVVGLAGSTKEIRLTNFYVERGVPKWEGMVIPVRGSIEVPIYVKEEDIRKLKKIDSKEKVFPADFKREVRFVDKEGKAVRLDIEYGRTVPSQDPDFSISGDRAGSSGQVTFVPKNKAQEELNALWKKYHLKSDIPFSMEQDVDDLIARIKDAEDDEQDDLGLDGWQLTAMKELAEETGETFTDAKDESYDNRFQDRDGLYLEGAGEYIVFESYDDAENACRDYVEEQLEEEPELFTQSWLDNYREINAGDIRFIADDLTEMDMDRSDDELKEEAESRGIDVPDDYEEKDDYAWRDELRDEIYNDHERELERDGKGYLVDDMGLYTEEDFNKQGFVHIDTKEASESAVREDGVAHFFAGYDGNEIELPSGAYAYRVN